MANSVKKELLFSVTAADCDWDYFRAGGPGGQYQNKTDSACRCTHRASGAVGISRDHRSQGQNKKAAFERMALSKSFKAWHRMEVARRMGQESPEDVVDRQMREGKIRVEGKDENGRWSEDAVKDIGE